MFPFSLNNIPIIGHNGGSKVKHFRKTRFWAENGQVRIIYEGHGDDFRVVPIGEFRRRAVALRDANRHAAWTDEYHETVSLVEAMFEVAKQAENQGNPHNPRHMKDVINAYSKNNIVVPHHSYTPPPLVEPRATGPIDINKQAPAPDAYLTPPTPTPEA